MRKGYWRTLTRQLRTQVASGNNQFVHGDLVFLISTVTAEDDASLEDGGELDLAAVEQGGSIVMDIHTSRVILIQADGQRTVLSEEFLVFVNSLCSFVPSALELGPVIGEPMDFVSPRPGILGD